jgi:hypothetical protein
MAAMWTVLRRAADSTVEMSGSDTVKLALVIAGAVLALAAATGCSSSATTSAPPGNTVRSAGPDTSSSGIDPFGPQQESSDPAPVKVTMCRIGKSSAGQSAALFQGEVTNTTRLSGTVSVEVWFIDEHGSVEHIDYLVADNVQPGQAAYIYGVESDVGDIFPGNKVTCSVRSVEVYT